LYITDFCWGLIAAEAYTEMMIREGVSLEIWWRMSKRTGHAVSLTKPLVFQAGENLEVIVRQDSGVTNTVVAAAYGWEE